MGTNELETDDNPCHMKKWHDIQGWKYDNYLDSDEMIIYVMTFSPGL